MVVRAGLMEGKWDEQVNVGGLNSSSSLNHHLRVGLWRNL